MSKLRINILANYAGQAWIAIMGIAFIPIYISILGMEPFGLVGLMLSLQSISMLFDLGAGGMINRELARRAHTIETASTSSDLVRTLEFLIWPIALIIAIIIWFTSPYIATHWLQPKQLSIAETTQAIQIMGLAIASLWPSSFYSSALSGLEQQPVLNLINALFSTLKSAGVLVILYWISPTITAFMYWYAIIGIIHSFSSMLILWKLLPSSTSAPQFQLHELHSVARFSSGLMLITVLSIAVTQLDRIILSATRPLIELGYYTLALSISAGMGRMVQPMFNALYPRYSRLVAQDSQQQLTELYHLSNQYVAIIIASISAVLIIFSKEIIYLWSGDIILSAQVATTLSILVAGTALNGLMNLPYALQLAYGWTQFAVKANLIALIFGIPFCIFFIKNHGLEAAAYFWFFTNLGFVIIGIPIMHRRYMRGELKKWYIHGIIKPFIVSISVALIAKAIFPHLQRDFLGILSLVTISFFVLFFSALTLPLIRLFIKNSILTRLYR